MATNPYIWLGKTTDVQAGGTLDPTAIPVDHWTVRPLLGWSRVAPNDVFVPALLIHQDNPALGTLLTILGAVEDPSPGFLAIGTPWKVFAFGQFSMMQTTALSPPPLPTQALLAYNQVAVPPLAPTAPSGSVAQVGPGNIVVLASAPTLQLTMPAPPGPGVDVTLTLVFDHLVLFSQTISLTGVTVAIHCDPTTGEVAVNGVPLNATSVGPAVDRVALGGKLALVFDPDDSTTAGRVPSFDVPIGAGHYIHQPLIKGLDNSVVRLDWTSLFVRLRDNQLSLVAQQPTTADAPTIATATFSIPLIQAKVDPLTINGLAKLIPGITLTFVVDLHPPSVGVGRVLWVFREFGATAQGIGGQGLRVLRASFKNNETAGPLGELFASLKELSTLDGSGVSFALDSVGTALDATAGATALVSAFQALDAFNTTDYPLPVALRLTDTASKRNFLFLAILRLDLWAGRLASNRVYFYFALAQGGTAPAAGGLDGASFLDLNAFAIEFPTRTASDILARLAAGPKNPAEVDRARPGRLSHDGYLDFATLDLVIDFQEDGHAERRRLAVLIPGQLGTTPALDDFQRRVQLLLGDFDPTTWPDDRGTDRLQLRIGPRGLTFAARAQATTPALIPVPDLPPSASLRLQLVEERDGLRSALVVIDNQVRYADISGRVEVPGFQSLEADVRLGLRRSHAEGPLVVTATIDLDRSDRQPLAELKAPYLRAQLDELRMQLTWVSQGAPNWDLRAWATGAVSLGEGVASTGGIDGLDQPRAIPFQDLDLTRLHQGQGKIRLGRSQPGDSTTPSPRPGDPTPSTADETARFELLDGQFRVEFAGALLQWNVPAGTAGFAAERAQFTYMASSGELDVAIDAGGINLDLNKSGTLRFGLSSGLGIQVRVGTQISFAGSVGWVDDAQEHYFRADGRVQMTGFPEVAVALKLGTGIKEDGSTAPNVALFGSISQEVDLFPGVVTKRLGLGLGINNRLAALGDNPDPRTILANLDRIEPQESRNWSFVTQKGVYVSVVAAVTLASNRGPDTTISAYVARLILSIDTDFNVAAESRVWLFSSLGYVARAANADHPALVAAATFKPCEQTFQLVAQTGPRPAIEANPMLANLLARAQARFSFYLSPDLADYYLEELVYSDEVFGISVLAAGSYRIAIGRFGALIRAQLTFRGNLPERSLALGPGGFTFSGALQVYADFGGLVSERGLVAYGTVQAALTFQVSAFLLVPSLEIQVRTFDVTFSITVSIPYLSCKRWRCKWKTREITTSVVVQVTLYIPVITVEPYHLPATSLQLMLAGALAFDESGGLGFSGTMGIDTTICGYPLRIAPRFDFRPELVANVQRRVAAVEDRINQIQGIPRPPAALPQDSPAPVVSEEIWYYYTSHHGDQVWHLLVPSPENPTWWYTPHATGADLYANLPRDTSELPSLGGASPLEAAHLSPFRGAVMRMVLPFVAEQNRDSLVEVVDLAMPWDRGNADSLPDKDANLTDAERIDLVFQLTRIEAAFLGTAALAPGLTETDLSSEQIAWENQETDPNRVPLTGVEIVSDPRPETGARVFWTLEDQLTRPEGVLPYRYRPVEELVAAGFAGVDRRDDIDRLLRFEEIRRRAFRQGRHQAADPGPTGQLAQARASLLSTILGDFTRADGARTYGPIDSIQLVRHEESNSKLQAITRRRLALQVRPEGTGTNLTYTAKLTYAILENSTELDLTPTDQNELTLEILWDIEGEKLAKPVTWKVETPIADPKRYETIASYDLKDDLVPAPGASLISGTGDPLIAPKRSLKVQVRRTFPTTATPSVAPTEALLVFEALPSSIAALDDDHYVRKVGLFAVTSASRPLKLRTDRVRIIRNEVDSKLATNSTLVDWSHEVAVRIISMSNAASDPIAVIQNQLVTLPPCQEFFEGSGKEGPRVRVRLPVRFAETLLKDDLPRLNGFEIFRQLPGDPQPVRVAEGVPPPIQLVDQKGGKALLVESFLYDEIIPFDRDAGRFLGSARGVVPGQSPVRYFLRAIPFGRPPSDQPGPLKPWPRFTLFVPPRCPTLPPLGLVIPITSLVEPDSVPWILTVHLVDRRPATYNWPADGPSELEVWAAPERIRSSGPYAVTDEPAEAQPRSAEARSIREPNDLATSRLPESVAGKVLLGRIKSPAQPGGPVTFEGFEVGGDRPVRPGRAWRLFVRVALDVAHPLVEPLALGFSRIDQDEIDATTPIMATDRLELIGKVEQQRVLEPVSVTTGGITAPASGWVPAVLVGITPRTRPDEPFERFRIAWEHLGDLDAGVEILTQDQDEPHQVGRNLVTAQEEALFQMALRDFRSPALWQAHPEPIDQPWLGAAVLGSAPSTDPDLTSLLLWNEVGRNPIVERVKQARTALAVMLTTVATAPPDWGFLFTALADYLAALRAYQRTPLAPAEPIDQLGLDVLLAAARATLIGLSVAPLIPAPDGSLTASQVADVLHDLQTNEETLNAQLEALDRIDLTNRQVLDVTEQYAALKAELQDVALARQLAAIIKWRRQVADDLVNPNRDPATDLPGASHERLPGFDRWTALLATFTTQHLGADSLTGKLFALFGDKVGTNTNATGLAGAAVVAALLGPSDGSAVAGVRDPSVLLAPIASPLQPVKDYQARVRQLVTQAAGLVATLDALKTDAEARGWTVLRRPHHQLGIEINGTKGRQPVSDDLKVFLPDALGGPNTAAIPGRPQSAALDSALLVVEFANLLERLGFALDLQVIDQLNQPLPQGRLVAWLANQPWDAIHAALGGTARPHDFLLVTGREPDTDRDDATTRDVDEDQALGYAFVKLIVVPRSILADLCGRLIPVQLTAIPAPPTGVAVTFDLTLAQLTAGGATGMAAVIPPDADTEVFEFDLSTLTALTAGGSTVNLPTLATPPVAGPYRVAYLEPTRTWLKERSINVADDSGLLQVQRMARAFLAACTNVEPTTLPHPLGQVIVETRGRRWATVPVLGSRAHIDWKAPDAAGRTVLIAVRRVSRYEALLRWAWGTLVPTLSQIPNLRSVEPITQTLIWKRRALGRVEEPSTLPVLISPHPARIEFIVALPTSGARATVSGLSSLRNGYRGLAARFHHRRITGTLVPDPTSAVPQPLIPLLPPSPQLRSIALITTNSPPWTVAGGPPAPSSSALVILVGDPAVARVVTFVPDPAPATTAKLTFHADESLPAPPTGLTSVSAIVIDPGTHEPIFFPNGVVGTLEWHDAGLTSLRIAALEPTSNRLEIDPAAYQGQILLIHDGNLATGYARVIKDFDVVNQVVTLMEAFPTTLPAHLPNPKFLLLTGSPPVQREPVPRVDSGTPTLFRHERLISLPSLVHYREYSVAVAPEFDCNLGKPPEKLLPLDSPPEVFARRRASLLASYPAHLTVQTTGTSQVYDFRIVVPRQGDFLTPAEAVEASALDSADLLPASVSGSAWTSLGQPDGYLPDLACLFQVLWQIPGTSSDGDPVFISLVNVALAGHPLGDPNAATLAQLVCPNKSPAIAPSGVSAPIQVWQPTTAARPVFEIRFSVTVKTDDSIGKLFADPALAVLQVARDGHPTQPFPISINP